MLGDNVYIDDPEEVKWTVIIAILEGIHALNGKPVAKTSMHAIYDDHDFGMDDCVPGSLVDEPKWKTCPRNR